jgi:tetratricopeptide (TPR) repeat protein
MAVQEHSQIQSEKKIDATTMIEVYKQKLQSDPNNAEILLNLGVVYVSLNKLNEADEIFNKILKQDPKNTEALNNLGIIYTQTGKFGDAVAKLEIAVKLNPNNAKYWNNLSEVHRRAGNYHKANTCRMHAIQLLENKK